ncbi:guanine nucleotide-binding subunit beta 1 [Babesia ovis]|uniref:Guanine nucleotide-binding subunit beta 1 n=1 Tax=Babesia ovis TaxID=5869 RepID=A0A9W5WU59_BABOV|nr:guanine nucleotide-binding subunit beta 1 [Babesia ovis]
MLSSSFSSSPSIEIPAPGEKGADVGSLQNIEPLPFLSNYHIVATYECGLVSIFDIRSHREPLMKRKLDDSETLLSLDVWRSVLLVGDAGGNISMFHVSDPTGIIPLERINICKGVDSPCGIGCLGVREDGAITVACCWDYSVRVLETRSLEVKAILGDHNDTIMDVSFDRLTGDFATCSLDGNGYMWNLFSSSYKRL